jgi:hypothetical protein
MSGKIVTIINPVELLLAQLQEIRDGNTATRKEIERQTRLLSGGEKEEARLERDLTKALDHYRKNQWHSQIKSE